MRRTSSKATLDRCAVTLYPWASREESRRGGVVFSTDASGRGIASIREEDALPSEVTLKSQAGRHSSFNVGLFISTSRGLGVRAGCVRNRVVLRATVHFGGRLRGCLERPRTRVQRLRAGLVPTYRLGESEALLLQAVRTPVGAVSSDTLPDQVLLLYCGPSIRVTSKTLSAWSPSGTPCTVIRWPT